jgi:DNA-binding CsgD family transcriptional regulator
MLLGRERECERLRRLIGDARRGRSGVLVVRGAPGVGKTALLDYLVQEAQGFQVLHVLGLASEQELPYSGLHALLRPVVPLTAQIPEVQARALRIALALESGSPDRFVAAAGVLSLLAEGAERGPVLVAVDDAHWLDPASRDALLFAARRLGAESIALVLVVRDGDADRIEEQRFEELEIRPLGEDDALALLRERWGASLDLAVARRLAAATGGNPLALVEVAQLLSEDERQGRVPLGETLPVPDAVARAVRRRLADVPPSTRRALLALAADELALDLLEPAELDPAKAVGLIRMDGRTTGFVHPLFRAAIYDVAGEDERRAAHAWLAEALAGRADADDRRAWHLAAAASGPDEAAAAALEATAGRAEARGGSAARAAALERAAELSEAEAARGQRLRAAANAAFLAGEPARALELIDRVLPGTDDPLVRADLVQQRVAILAWKGPPVPADLIEHEAALVLQVDPERAAGLLAQLESAAICGLDARAFRRAADQIEPLLPRLGAWWRPRSIGGVAEARMWNGETTRARELYAEMLKDPVAAATHGPALIQLELYEEARRALDASLEVGRRSGQPLRIAWTQACFGQLEQVLGRTPQAIAAATEALSLAEAMEVDAVAGMALVTLATIAARRGQGAECRRAAMRAEEIGVRLRDDHLRASAQLPLALLALGEGDHASAAALLQPVADRLAAGGIVDPSVVPCDADLIESHVRLGDSAAARRLLDSFSARAEAARRPSAQAEAARCEGLRAAADDFDRWFRAALDRHDLVPSGFARARTQLCYGERLRRARRRRDAREQLRAALAAFETGGDAAWAERARAELDATGEHVRRRDPTAPEQLTPQELQIALQVADGRTNREIAAAVFLSPKTVEYHLTHVYRKLGLHSRAELIRRFATEPLPADSPAEIIGS